MSEDKMIGMIDAKYRRKVKAKREAWGVTEYRNNPDGSVQGYEEYVWTDYSRRNWDEDGPLTLKGVVRWWRK